MRVEALDDGGNVGEINLVSGDPDAAPQLASPAAQNGGSAESSEGDPGGALDRVE